MPLASSTVMVPSLPTLSMASAMMLPISSSQLADTVATWAISLVSLTFLEICAELRHEASEAFRMPRCRRDRVGAGGDVAETLLVDGLGEDGRRRGAVTGDVGGLRGDLADELGAHVLVGVLELDLLGHRSHRPW